MITKFGASFVESHYSPIILHLLGIVVNLSSHYDTLLIRSWLASFCGIWLGSVCWVNRANFCDPVLRFFFLVLTISLFSSMDGTPLVPKCFRSMPLHASSSWHVSITYMPPTSCSPFLSYAYYLMPNDLFPCLSLIIYTLFVLCPPCLFRIIYIHTPYAFHTLTMLSLVYKRL